MSGLGQVLSEYPPKQTNTSRRQPRAYCGVKPPRAIGDVNKNPDHDTPLRAALGAAAAAACPTVTIGSGRPAPLRPMPISELVGLFRDSRPRWQTAGSSRVAVH